MRLALAVHLPLTSDAFGRVFRFAANVTVKKEITSLIPIEIYEIVREVHLVRVLVLVANVAIVLYLVRRRELFEG